MRRLTTKPTGVIIQSMMTRRERFFQKVDMGKNDNTCCWNWLGATVNGYGRFWVGDKAIQAHWFLLDAHPPKGMEACHKCDNKLCVRPSHIFIGTRADNMQDCVSKGRLRPQNGNIASRTANKNIPKGEKNWQSKMTEAQALRAKNCPRKRGAAAKLALEFGVSIQAICNVRDGKRWKHLPTGTNAGWQSAK